jgi:glyoxylase-like metal-dependent hydrolase (beta-lactamase superfamily II)
LKDPSLPKIKVDTLTAWDKDTLLKELKFHHVAPEKVDYLVCTHGHSDHCGNMNLFLNATHFLGSCVSHKHLYAYHDFDNDPYVIDKNIEVVSTPGHTSTCVSLIVRNTNLEGRAAVAIVGDLFEKEEDVFDESLWMEAGTEDVQQQKKNRLKIAEMVEFIYPGHGPRFRVTEEIREKLRRDAEN